MLTTRIKQAMALLPILALGTSLSLADEQARAERTPVRTAQIDSHGRYPFGQFRGGYRYPFSYPYYRYGGSRHYPYSSRLYPFGVGPYGPYGSNYGGYSGNMYDPQVYGRLSPTGPTAPDAPPADEAPPAKAAPPSDATAPANPAQKADVPPNNSQADAKAGPAVDFVPVPEQLPMARGPVPYLGGHPMNGIFGVPFFGYGIPYAYGVNPYGYFGNNYFFGMYRPFFGFGMVPPPPYYYFDGPSSDSGYFNPQLAPPVYNLQGRNYGPAYRTPGGVNLGPGHYDGF